MYPFHVMLIIRRALAAGAPVVQSVSENTADTGDKGPHPDDLYSVWLEEVFFYLLERLGPLTGSPECHRPLI